MIQVAIEDYARKLYLEHVVKYYMYCYIVAEHDRLKAWFAAADALSEEEE